MSIGPTSSQGQQTTTQPTGTQQPGQPAAQQTNQPAAQQEIRDQSGNVIGTLTGDEIRNPSGAVLGRVVRNASGEVTSTAWNINQLGSLPANSPLRQQYNALQNDVNTRRQELQTSARGLDTRIRGAEANMRNTEREMEDINGVFTGFFSRVTGTRAALQRTLDADTRYRDNLVSQRDRQNTTMREVDRLIQSGNLSEAHALLNGNEARYRQEMRGVGRQAILDLQAANQDLSQAAQSAARWESGLTTARNVCVVGGAIIATGGFAAAGFIPAAIAGTVAGTSIGALSNTAGAISQVGHGNMSAGDATMQALRQTGQDALTSAQVGISGGAAGSVGRGAGALLGTARAGTLAGRLTIGASAGTTGGFTGSVLNTGTNIALGRERRTAGQIAVDTVAQTLTGTLSGVAGAGTQFRLDRLASQQGGTTSALQQVLYRGAGEVAAPLALATGGTHLAHSLTGREAPGLEHTLESAASNILGAYVGARVSAAHNQGATSTRQIFQQEFLSAPTLGRLFSRTQPPAAPGANPTLGITQSQPAQQGSTTTIPHSELPPSIQNSNAFRYANGNTRATHGSGNRTPRSVAVEVDSNLPQGARPQAEVVVDPRTGARTTRIRLDQETYQRLQSGDQRALQNFQHELRHANRSNLVDVHVRDGNGNITRTRSAREYVALRVLEEFQVRAGRSTGERPNSPNVRHVREVQRLIASGDHAGAIRYGRQNGIVGSDLRNYGTNYATNRRNPNQVVQKGNATDEATTLLEEVSSSHAPGEIRAALELASNDTVRLAILDNLVQRIQANPSTGLRNSQTRDLTAVARELGLNQQLSQVFQQRGVGSVRRNPTTSPAEETPAPATRRTVPDVNRAKEILTEIGCTFPGGRLRSVGRSENGSPVYEVIAPDGRRLFISYDQGSGNTNRNGQLQQHNGGTWKLMREVSDNFFNRDRNIVLDENLNPISVNQPNQPE